METKEIVVTQQELNASVPNETLPLNVTELHEEFKPFLKQKAFEALRNKAQNTVVEYFTASNGNTIFLDQICKIDHHLVDRFSDILQQVDPGIKKGMSWCQFGGITAKVKFKDREILDDTVILNPLAEIYNKLIEEDLILPMVFATPFKLPLAMYDEAKRRFTWYKDGKCFPSYDAGLISLKHKLSVEAEGSEEAIELTKKIADLEREYTTEEINELTFRVMYCLFVFPSQKFVELTHGKPYYKEFNKIIGKEFFNPEGAIPAWEIEF